MLRCGSGLPRNGEFQLTLSALAIYITLTSSATDVTVQHSIETLSSCSLINPIRPADSFSIHPLVHFWAREHLSSDSQQRVVKEAIDLVGRANSVDKNIGWG